MLTTRRFFGIMFIIAWERYALIIRIYRPPDDCLFQIFLPHVIGIDDLLRSPKLHKESKISYQEHEQSQKYVYRNLKLAVLFPVVFPAFSHLEDPSFIIYNP